MPLPIDSPKAVVRLAGAADIPEIVRITNLAYRVEAFCLAGDRTDPKDVGELMAAGEFWVLDGAPGRLRGSVYLKPAGDRGYLGLLAVDPEAQGQGWSRLLVAAGEQRCQAAGCRFLDLTVVNLREELFGFYQKLGFVAGDTLPFPRPAKMILDCRLIRFTKPLRPLPAST